MPKVLGAVRCKVERKRPTIDSTISFSREDYHWLMQVVRARNCSKSMVMRDALEMYRNEYTRAMALVELEWEKKKQEEKALERKTRLHYTSGRFDSEPVTL